MERFIHTKILSIDEDDESLHEMGVPVEESWLPYSFRINDVESFYPCIRDKDGEVGTIVNMVHGGVITINMAYTSLMRCVEEEVTRNKWLIYN